MKENKILEGVYVTRSSEDVDVEVWPETVGIRKFHGCTEYGAAWNSSAATGQLSSDGTEYSTCLLPGGCRRRFGFYPRGGTAWHVSSKGRRTKVDIAFSP